MSALGQGLNGRCLCGAVRFTATPLEGMHACHCETCRRTSGGVFLSVDCGDSVVVESPEALTSYASSEWAERQFCGACGSSLFWRGLDGQTTMVSIQAFDDPAAFPFESEYCIDLKPASYGFSGDQAQVTEAELTAMFTEDPA